MEWLAFPQHGIEDGEELSGNGDEGELSWFAGGDQVFKEGFEAWGMPGGDEGGDIEGIAHALSTATD